MQLVADRFVIRDDGEVIDLATGHGVVLTIAAAGGGADQARWAVRCHALHTLCHPAIAPLLDYGALGESQRFEAWGCGRTWSGARTRAERVVGAASSFWRACALTVGGCSSARVHQETGRPLVLPDGDTGYPCDPRRENVPSDEAIEHCGILHVERRAAGCRALGAGRRRKDQRDIGAGARRANEGFCSFVGSVVRSTLGGSRRRTHAFSHRRRCVDRVEESARRVDPFAASARAGICRRRRSTRGSGAGARTAVARRAHGGDSPDSP